MIVFCKSINFVYLLQRTMLIGINSYPKNKIAFKVNDAALFPIAFRLHANPFVTFNNTNLKFIITLLIALAKTPHRLHQTGENEPTFVHKLCTSTFFIRSVLFRQCAPRLHEFYPSTTKPCQ